MTIGRGLRRSARTGRLAIMAIGMTMGVAIGSRTAEVRPWRIGRSAGRPTVGRRANRCPLNMMFCRVVCPDVIVHLGRSRQRRWHGRLSLRERQRNCRTWRLFIPLERAEKISRCGHGGTGIDSRDRLELRKCSRHVKVRGMAEREGVHLPGRHESTNDFAYFAAGRERGEEQLHIFHAGGDDRLQVDGGKY